MTSTVTLHGRRGTYGTGLALVARLGLRLAPLSPQPVGVPGVALGDIDLHFAWQVWHLVTSTVTLRGGRGAWRHRPSLCMVWLWWRAWVSVWRRCRRCWRGTCVAGVALGDIDRHFVWRAWRLVTSTVTLRGGLWCCAWVSVWRRCRRGCWHGRRGAC